MGYSMVNWNENLMCAIDTETTGLDPNFHEMIEISIVPIDSYFNVRQDVIPFDILIKPDYPERIDKAAMKKNKIELDKIMEIGYDNIKAMDMFIEWAEALPFRYTRGGNRKKILPLVFNGLAFDIPFIKQWLTLDLYNEYFTYQVRDIYAIVQFISDSQDWANDRQTFNHFDLDSMCKKMCIEFDKSHRALDDAVKLPKLYRKLLEKFKVMEMYTGMKEF